MHMYHLNVAEIKTWIMNEGNSFLFCRTMSLGLRWINIPGIWQTCVGTLWATSAIDYVDVMCCCAPPLLACRQTTGIQRFVFSSTSIASVLAMLFIAVAENEWAVRSRHITILVRCVHTTIRAGADVQSVPTEGPTRAEASPCVPSFSRLWEQLTQLTPLVSWLADSWGWFATCLLTATELRVNPPNYDSSLTLVSRTPWVTYYPARLSHLKWNYLSFYVVRANRLAKAFACL